MRFIGVKNEGLDRMGNVLQLERTKFFEFEVEPSAHMVADRSRNADAAWRTFDLKSCRHIDHVTVKISSIRNRVSYVDSEAEENCPVWRWAVVIGCNLLLDPYSAAHCSIDAVKDEEEGITASVHDSSIMLSSSRIYQTLTNGQ
jgi:hypothetical protein